MSPKALPGFRDFYPEQLAERAFIFETWRQVVRRYGFVEYDGPPLEPLDLYTKKSGDELLTQAYNFVDKGGREVTMRPEMTPTFARMVAAKAQSLRKPIRWFSVPQLFRYERQQKGRLREHYQLNVDVVGEAHVLADAELLSVAIEIMSALGLTSDDVRARVSDRRLLNGLLSHLGIADEQLPAVYAVLDKLERQPRDISAEKLTAAGLDAATVEVILGFDTLDFETLQSRYGSAPLVQEHVQRFAEYLSYADSLGTKEWIRFDLTIVRGLAYYTGIVFELFDAVGEFRAICGGGRYDKLLSTLGDVDLPALGFGMGDVVLGELLRQRGKMPVFHATEDRYFIVAGEGVRTASVLTLASALRRMLPEASFSHGLNPSAIETRKTAKQVDDGRASGANYFLWLTNGKDPSDSALQLNISHASIKSMYTLDATATHALLSRERGIAPQRAAADQLAALAQKLAADSNTDTSNKR